MELLVQLRDEIDPPKPVTFPATLPLTAAAVDVATGDVKVKLLGAFVQLLTFANVLPKPY